MRRLVVFLSLSLAFIAPLASVPEVAFASSHGTDCRRKRAKKQTSEPNPKTKDKGKDKKQYGFEL